MADRDEMLRRVAEALRGPTAPSVHPESERRAFRATLPPGGETHAERLALFAEHATRLRAEFVVDGSLAAIAKREGWKRVASHHAMLTDALVPGLVLPVLWTDGGYAASDLEQVDAGITECEALIAQTGSILVTSSRSGGRGLSVLPPHHVVLARSVQLLPDLAAGYALLRENYGENPPSFISLITGPSRTGDIERILVLGAHGPAKLTILLDPVAG